MERYALLFLYLQGGGLDISGTATLTNTNVYSNQAVDVRSPFQLSLNFHPSPRCMTRARVLLAGWRTCCVWHSDADQHQRLLESGFRGVLTFCPYLKTFLSVPP